MTLTETAQVLALAAAFDRRTVGDADVYAWQATLGDTDFEDAKTAVVAHYRISSEWLMPAQIRAAVAKIRAQRLTNAGPEPAPQVDPDDVVAYQRELRAQRAHAADGQRIPQIQGGVS